MTLIERLVVISLIGALIASLLPADGSVRFVRQSVVAGGEAVSRGDF